MFLGDKKERTIDIFDIDIWFDIFLGGREGASAAVVRDLQQDGR